jgi:cytoskeletal protein RodZ
MNGRRNSRARNNELPIPARGPDPPTPDGRIELAPPPDIDIAQDHIGTLFTERRRAMGLKVEEIAEDIKVKPDYLRAIEQERFDLLPTPQYARLFIKAYAERLGFNLPEVFALLDVNESLAAPVSKPKDALPQAETPRRPSAPAEGTPPVKDPRLKPFVRWGMIAVAAIALGVVAWFVLHSGKSKPRPAASAAQTPVSLSSIPIPEPAPAEGEDSLPLTVGTVTAEPMNLVLEFSADTWVSLEADHDTVVRSRIVKTGERIEASAVESIMLSLGHTDGVKTATLNGRTIGPLSVWGRRLNRYLITQDSVHTWLGASQIGSAASQPGNLQQSTADTGGTH